MSQEKKQANLPTRHWRFILVVSVLCAALLSCGRPAPPQSDAAPPRVRAAAFGDADRQDFPGRNPHSYAVQGIDASRWQGAIDWPQAAASGVSFSFLKATEGGDGLDPTFAANWQGAAHAGIPRGAFHYFYWCRPATEQARWFIQNVPRASGALPPVLDLEWTPFSPTCTLRPDAASVRSEAQIFLTLLERHYGQRPLIYTTPDFYADAQLSRLQGYDFWLRAVADHPSNVYPGQAWTFWQYSGTGLVPGIKGKTDLNAFAGSTAEWSSWLASRAQ